MKFKVRVGQTWKTSHEGEEITIKILDMFIAKTRKFTLFYKIQHTRGNTQTEDLMIDLHEQLEDWELVDESAERKC